MFFEKEKGEESLIVHMNKSATWLSAAVWNIHAELMKKVQHSPLKKSYQVKHQSTIVQVSVIFYFARLMLKG